MPRFYYEPSEKQGNRIVMTGEDVNHIKNVLRSRVGDTFTLCDGMGTDCEARITDLSERNSVTFEVVSENPSDTELPVRIVLYQGIPKKDKMELIIQKAVELGASEIVPVAMKRCIAKIEDDRAEEKKNLRWQEIARAAAKQSGRGIIPVVQKSMSFKNALERAAGEGKNSGGEPANAGFICMPYENAEGMKSLSDLIDKVKACVKQSAVEGETHGVCAAVSVFIGPEGGIDPTEVETALSKGASTVSLGKRILRTETAGLTTLSILMYELEKM